MVEVFLKKHKHFQPLGSSSHLFCYLFCLYTFLQPPKAKVKAPKSPKLSKAEKEKLKKEEAERKAREEGNLYVDTCK